MIESEECEAAYSLKGHTFVYLFFMPFYLFIYLFIICNVQRHNLSLLAHIAQILVYTAVQQLF